VALLDLYSRRNKPLPDVFVYDLSDVFRTQFVHMLQDAFNGEHNSAGTVAEISDLGRKMRREFGVFKLTDKDQANTDLTRFVLIGDTDRVLDVIEQATRCVLDCYERQRSSRAASDWVDPRGPNFVNELNQRLRIAGIGYEFNKGSIIRVDSSVVHAEVVRPALLLLADPLYANADDEYRDAHKHYREGDYDDCLVGCGRALETVLKTICKEKNWAYDPAATARPLIQTVIKNGLVRASSEEQLNQLSGLLVTTVPTPRNKEGGHGKGPDGVPPTEKVARYLLHQTAATILLLVESARG